MIRRILYGTAVMTVLAISACSLQADVIPVDAVRLDYNAMMLRVGESAVLTATVHPEDASNKKVIWKSTNAPALSVTQDGMLTANAPGLATVVAAAGDGVVAATCEVTVIRGNIVVTGVSITRESVTLAIGEQIQLVAAVTPSGAFNDGVGWDSSDGSVATVTANGLVTAVGAGEASISVTTDDGKFTDECIVTVMAPEVERYTVAVSVEGSGHVEINPVSDDYEENTVVTLTAAPDLDFLFAGWAGTVESVENPLVLTLTADVSLTARFEPAPPPGPDPEEPGS